MKKSRSLVNVFLKAAACAVAMSAMGCASQQVSDSAEHDGNGVAQGTSESELSTVKPKQEERVSPLVRVPHGRSKSP